MRELWLLALSACGNLCLFAVPLAFRFGAEWAVRRWFDTIGVDGRGLELLCAALETLDRAGTGTWLLLALGLALNMLCWRLTTLRECVLGGWALTAMLMWLY